MNLNRDSGVDTWKGLASFLLTVFGLVYTVEADEISRYHGERVQELGKGDYVCTAMSASSLSYEPSRAQNLRQQTADGRKSWRRRLWSVFFSSTLWRLLGRYKS